MDNWKKLGCYDILYFQKSLLIFYIDRITRQLLIFRLRKDGLMLPMCIDNLTPIWHITWFSILVFIGLSVWSLIGALSISFIDAPRGRMMALSLSRSLLVKPVDHVYMFCSSPKSWLESIINTQMLAFIFKTWLILHHKMSYCLIKLSDSILDKLASSSGSIWIKVLDSTTV
jgi:hypothetical protein